jgi:hypothetical protein
MTPNKKNILWILIVIAIVLALRFSYSAVMEYVLHAVEHQ